MNEIQIDAKTEITRNCVLVLGMHRSGTSALSGLLTLVGCDQPKNPIAALKENPKGFFESKPIKQLNDDLLSSGGSSWHDWTEFSPHWFDSPKFAEFRAQALDLLNDEFGASSLFVLKDPRICRIAPFWFQVLEDAGCRTRVIHIHRHPLEVAESLKLRNGVETGYGLILWARHVLDAEAASRSYPRHFVRYTNLLENPSLIVTQAQTSLGIRWPRRSALVDAEIERFITPDLRHFSQSPDRIASNSGVSEWVRQIFAIVERWADHGEDTADHATLDAIRDALNSAQPMFARLIVSEPQLAERNKKLVTEVAEAKDSAEKALAENGRHLEKIGELEGQIAAAAAAQADDRTRLASMTTALDQARSDLSDVQDQLKQRQAEWKSAREELDQARSNLAQRTLETEQQSEALRILRADLSAAQRSSKTSCSEVARLQEQLRNAKTEISERFDELARLTQMLIEAEGKSKAVAAHAVRMEAQRDALLSSKSWRITAPLRRFVDAGRKIRGRS